MCNNVSYNVKRKVYTSWIFSFRLFTVVILIVKHQIACVCNYLWRVSDLSLENEWLFYIRIFTVGYIHSCHHTYLSLIQTFYWREWIETAYLQFHTHQSYFICVHVQTFISRFFSVPFLLSPPICLKYDRNESMFGKDKEKDKQTEPMRRRRQRIIIDGCHHNLQRIDWWVIFLQSDR